MNTVIKKKRELYGKGRIIVQSAPPRSRTTVSHQFLKSGFLAPDSPENKI